MSRRIRTLALFGALPAPLTVGAEANCPAPFTFKQQGAG